MNNRILIVEDDHPQNDVLANFLRHEGFEVVSAYSLKEARENLNEQTDLLILDVILPDGNGLEYLKEIREHYGLPVIVLTALDDEFTQIYSFDLSADEYVDKPVSPMVMTKRVKALMNRIYGDQDIVNIKGIGFDFKAYRVLDREKNEVSMTTKEINLIHLLYANRGCVVTRNQILDAVWGTEYIGEDRLIDTHIKNIRKKLGKDIIVTVKGVGYRIGE